MISNMIIPNLDTYHYSYLRYFLLQYLNAITTIWVYTTYVCKLLSLECPVIREMMNIVLFDNTSS